MTQADLSLESYWADLCPPDSERRRSQRPGAIKPSWEPDIDRVKKWVSGVGVNPTTPIILIEGPTPTHRSTIYRLTKTVQDDLSGNWLETGLVSNLTERLSKVRSVGSIIPHDWDILWNLLTLEELKVEDGPVRTLVDQGHLFTEGFKAIWEARFRLEEGQELQTFVSTLSRWLTAAPLSPEEKDLLGTLGVENELETVYERLDMLFFLATLARQNDLLFPTVLVVDGIERMLTQGTSKRRELLKEFSDFVMTAERWARLGSPLGFMLGYSNEHEALEGFERANVRFGEKLYKYALV